MIQKSFFSEFFNELWKYGRKGYGFENLGDFKKKMDISWTSWSLGLTWTNKLSGMLDGKVNSWTYWKRLKALVEILFWFKIKVYLIHVLGRLGRMSCYQRMMIRSCIRQM